MTDEARATQIHEAIKASIPDGMGFGGQCAAFAVVLNRVLGGDGTYLAADGQHYEYVEHVALSIDGEIYDASGRIDMDKLKGYAEPEEGDEPGIIEIDDESIRAMVDSTGGGIYPALDENLIEARLRSALGAEFFAASPRM
jgi:hypothetical protein